MTQFAPHKALKLIALGKLTCAERFVVHRLVSHGGFPLVYRKNKGDAPPREDVFPFRTEIEPHSDPPKYGQIRAIFCNLIRSNPHMHSRYCCLPQRPRIVHCLSQRPRIVQELCWNLERKALKFKNFGNEGYYTNSLILLMKMMLCSKLHCQKFFKLKSFSYKIILVLAIQDISMESTLW